MRAGEQGGRRSGAGEATRRTVEAIWRVEAPRIIARVTRVVGDVGLAEDVAQDALVAALEQWPRDGVPDNPGAWLTTAARNRAVDRVRRDVAWQNRASQIGHDLRGRPDAAAAELEAAEEDLHDDVLRLIFTACHPVLPAQGRIALTLRMVAGLTTPEIARAFLVSEATIGQRIWRAKKLLAQARVPFEVPSGDELAPRLASVCEVVYLVFNEGYSATAGQDWLRADLCHDAVRLGRMLAVLAPAEPEVHGLLALMEIQASRLRARVDAQGRPVLLLNQDRSRWDWLLVRRGLAALARATALGGPTGRYTLQAGIAACHARARRPEDTDWAEIVRLYGRLAELAPSPVVELNKAVALSFVDGPAAALALIDRLAGASELSGYHLLPSVRGDLLARLGRTAEAREEFERAARLTANEVERDLLLARADDPGAQAP